MDRKTFKKQAEALRAESEAQGQPMTASQSLELLAHSQGHRDWNTASALLDRAPEERPERRNRQKAARRVGQQKDERAATTPEARSKRFFSRLPIVRRLHPITRHSFDDAELARVLDPHLEDILRDLSQVRRELEPLREDPAAQDLIAALYDTEGDGWLVYLQTHLMQEGRWMYLPFGQDVDRFAAHEDALASADGEAELSWQETRARQQAIARLRSPETGGVRPRKATPSDPAAWLSVLRARHLDRVGFPDDQPGSAERYEVQEARQLDRLEAVSLMARLERGVRIQRATAFPDPA